MTLRRIVFQVMLWSLGLAALGGALAALFTHGDTIGRVIGSGMLVSLACALMLPIARASEKRVSRAAALVGTVFVVAELAGFLALVWEVPTKFLGWGFANRFWGMMVVNLFGGVGISSMVRLGGSAENRPAGVVGTVGATAGWVLGVVSVWYTDRPFQDDVLTGTAWIVGFCGMVSGICLVRTKERVDVGWRWIGVATLVVGGFLLQRELSLLGAVGRDWLVLGVTLLSIGTVITLHVVFAAMPLRTGQRWLRGATLLVAIGAALALDGMILLENFVLASRDVRDIVTRLAGAGGIVTCCGTLAILVLGRMNWRVDRPAPLTEMETITLHCPACQKKQEIGVGGAACVQCGLRMMVELVEPRCGECDYSLLGQRYERCPECGEAVG